MSTKYNTKGARNQDLIAARQELKEFRHQVALLKKNGLIDRKKYDARKVINSGNSGKYLKSQIKKFSDVIKGEAKPVKVSKEKQKYYKERGYKIKSGKVIVPKKSNENIYGTHGDFVRVTKHPSGKITVIDLGMKTSSITKWKEQLRKKKLKLSGDERLAFSFSGNNSYMTFRTIDQLLDYLDNYEDITEQESDNPSERQQKIIESIAIFRVERRAAWERTPFHGTERHEMQKERNRIRRERWFSHMSDAEYNRYMDKRAEYEKQRREKIKQQKPADYEMQKEKARERARKSYLNKKSGK